MKRAYKEAWPFQQVLVTIKESAGKYLDPQMVSRFLELQPRILEIRNRWNPLEATQSKDTAIAGFDVAVFDPATSRELFGNDEAESREWLAAYIVSATQLLAGVERSAAGGDRHALAADAHKLASESLAVGAMRLGTLVRRLEAAAPHASEAELRRLVAAVTAASRDAQAAIVQCVATRNTAL